MPQTLDLPTVALTMGDPAGVGPEVVLKALADPEVAPIANWIVVGDSNILERRLRRYRASALACPPARFAGPWLL